MLTVKGITKIFNQGTVNENVALSDFSLTLEEGDFVTVIGGNGAGKSTLLNCVAGVYTIDQGSIFIGDKYTLLPIIFFEYFIFFSSLRMIYFRES